MQDHFLRRFVANQCIVGPAKHLHGVHAQASAGIRLRVEIHEKHLAACFGQVGAEIDGRGCLAHAALLVDQSVDPAHGRTALLAAWTSETEGTPARPSRDTERAARSFAKRAAKQGSPVSFRAIAKAAAKMSPAPVGSTSCAVGG